MLSNHKGQIRQFRSRDFSTAMLLADEAREETGKQHWVHLGFVVGFVVLDYEPPCVVYATRGPSPRKVSNEFTR